MLGSDNQLMSFQFSGGQAIEIEVMAPTVEATGQLVTRLKDVTYVEVVELTYLHQNETIYEAGLNVLLDVDLLKKELDHHD